MEKLKHMIIIGCDDTCKFLCAKCVEMGFKASKNDTYMYVL